MNNQESEVECQELTPEQVLGAVIEDLINEVEEAIEAVHKASYENSTNFAFKSGKILYALYKSCEKARAARNVVQINNAKTSGASE